MTSIGRTSLDARLISLDKYRSDGYRKENVWGLDALGCMHPNLRCL